MAGACGSARERSVSAGAEREYVGEESHGGRGAEEEPGGREGWDEGRGQGEGEGGNQGHGRGKMEDEGTARKRGGGESGEGVRWEGETGQGGADASGPPQLELMSTGVLRGLLRRHFAGVSVPLSLLPPPFPPSAFYLPAGVLLSFSILNLRPETRHPFNPEPQPSTRNHPSPPLPLQEIAGKASGPQRSRDRQRGKPPPPVLLIALQVRNPKPETLNPEP